MTVRSERYDHGGQGRKAIAREKVWELRLAGASFGAIAKEVGISKTYSQKLYKEALDERHKRVEGMVDKYVAHQCEQYDRIILAHWARRMDPTNAAIIMRAMADKAKLLGLNAAQKVEHTGMIEHSHESEQERSSRLMQEAAAEIAAMTPEQLAAEAATLSGR